VLDENEYYVWKVEEQTKLLAQKNIIIIVAESALNTCRNEVILGNQIEARSSIMIKDREEAIVDLGLKYDKSTMKLKRTRIIAITSFVAGILVGGYIVTK